MLTVNDFDFPLPPPEQIAQYPLSNRSESRLMCYQRDKKLVNHHHFHHLLNYLVAGDLLVFNNTKVIPARMFGKKNTGGQVEILFERIADTPRKFLAHIRVNKPLKPDIVVFLDSNQSNERSPYAVKMIEKQQDLFLLELIDSSPGDMTECMDACGHIPLPPYIQREDTLEDHTRYQTVYAEQVGAVAAPTAGLHFDKALLEQLKEKGVQQAFLTLHVGAGTFQPVRVESIAEHQMHSEYLEVSSELCEKIDSTKRVGGRVIAVGTTVVRALETAARAGKLAPYSGDTDIFITPGYRFNVIDGLITNFHWPRSTLLMLVSALIEREKLLSLYEEAIKNGYRFFSYGDAMLIL